MSEMQRIVDHFTEPRDHLALDEAILLAADEGDGGESMRVWEFAGPVVVAGRSTRVDQEVDVEYCRQKGIEILRRCSGGASVLGGPGCLMYSVVLALEGTEELRKIDVAHRHVMGRVLHALQCQLPSAEFQGTCDLTWHNRKCSGNSLRVARRYLLYHGTLLYAADLSLIGRALNVAPRQPEYRGGREHLDFVTNVPVQVSRFIEDLSSMFHVTSQRDTSAFANRIAALRESRYDDPRWHFRH